MEWLDKIRAWFSGARKMTFEDFRDVQRMAREANDLLREILPIGPEILPVMTFRDAIGYFVRERPPTALVKKGAMLLQPHPNGHLLVQVFLDEKNEFVHRPDNRPYGRRVIVRQLDDELTEAFAGKDLVIVE